MNITPEQIPDSAVEAAIKAFDAKPYPFVKEAWKDALAAALPVLLGEAKAWTEKDGDEWVVYDANSEVGQHILHYQKDMHFIRIFPIFSFATPETPNAHP